MFSGIIERQGRVRAIERDERAMRLVLETGLDDLALGESVSVNGVCLTVAAVDATGGAAFFVSPETLDRSSLGGLREQLPVNLERAVTPATRLSGHMVQGHVDGVARLRSVEKLGEADGGAWSLVLELPDTLRRYCVEKGSIALDGISLTVNAIRPCDAPGRFEIALMIIPHSWTHTNLGTLAPGAVLNVEVDVIAKYVEQLCRRPS